MHASQLPIKSIFTYRFNCISMEWEDLSVLEYPESDSFDQWREVARIEIRALIKAAKSSETTTHLRRRLVHKNPIHSQRGGGVSIARIRRLIWMQVLFDELAVREQARIIANGFAELEEFSRRSTERSRKRKGRLKLLGRNPAPTR
jgi:hypothetical protein